MTLRSVCVFFPPSAVIFAAVKCSEIWDSFVLSLSPMEDGKEHCLLVLWHSLSGSPKDTQILAEVAKEKPGNQDLLGDGCTVGQACSGSRPGAL